MTVYGDRWFLDRISDLADEVVWQENEPHIRSAARAAAWLERQIAVGDELVGTAQRKYKSARGDVSVEQRRALRKAQQHLRAVRFYQERIAGEGKHVWRELLSAAVRQLRETCYTLEQSMGLRRID